MTRPTASHTDASDASHHAAAGSESRGPRWRSWIAKVAFESLMILVSILLAFAIDNWRERNARQQALADARASLIAEIRFNRALLLADTHLPHHRRLRGIYREMYTRNGVDRADALFEGGVHPTPLRDAAWRSFMSSSAANDLPFAERTRLAGIYGAIDGLAAFHLSMLGAVMEPRSDRESPAYVRDMVRAFSMYLTDVVANEEGILKDCDAALAELTASAGR